MSECVKRRHPDPGAKGDRGRIQAGGAIGLVLLVLALASSAFAEGASLCRIDSIAWTGEHTALDESQMQGAVGEPCDAWNVYAQKLIRHYEDRGFVAAQIQGNILESGGKHVLSLSLVRGSAWVWAAAENLDSSGTRPDVFQRLSGIEEGVPVSLTDLERSQQKLLRLGYFESSAPARLFRDPARNRLVPAFSMKAARNSEAEGLLTYSSDGDLWEGEVNVKLYNILGTARDLTLQGFTGENSRHLNFMYKEPWIFGSSWNVVLRGLFDEEIYTVSPDSLAGGSKDVTERVAMGEVGVTRDIGFNWTVGIFLGMTEDDKHSTFELTYVSLDRFALPRSGLRLDGSASWKMDRPDSLDSYLDVHGRLVSYHPLFGNFIARYTGAAGGIFPTDVELKRLDYFALGGMDSFKGMGYRFLRSRAYGFSEAAFVWQDGYNLSVEAFYQPGLYRRLEPGHGWAREQDYGVAFTQYRGNWSVNLYYALRNGENYLDGIIGFGIKTLF
jgi:outer membrane protein assembly factor BamA